MQYQSKFETNFLAYDNGSWYLRKQTRSSIFLSTDYLPTILPKNWHNKEEKQKQKKKKIKFLNKILQFMALFLIPFLNGQQKRERERETKRETKVLCFKSLKHFIYDQQWMASCNISRAMATKDNTDDTVNDATVTRE